MNKYLWEILVPVANNDGCKFTIEYHKLWDTEVRRISSGLSICVTLKGEWVSPNGSLFREKMIPVRIFCSRPEIEEISDFTAKHYSQNAIMYYKISDEVVIKNYEK